MTAAIEAINLVKNYGGRRAVDGVSFTVEGGRVCGLIGANGSGKSTTMRMLLGLTRPTAGESRVLGVPYRDLKFPARQVGALLDSEYHPGRTARAHLRYYCQASRIPLSRIDEVLDAVDLADKGNVRVGDFSLGMGQRLSLAAALIGEPQVLILDEPNNGLDPYGVRWLRTYLRELAETGVAVLIASHGLAELEQTVDDVVMLDEGRCVLQQTTEEIKSQIGRSVRARVDEPEVLAAALEEANLSFRTVGRATFRITGVSTDEVGRLASEHELTVLELMAESAATLEEQFFAAVRARR